MIINIFRTAGVRVLAALLNLGVIIIAGQQLGAENMGKISLFILSVTLINLVSGFAGGSALVYLIPRNLNKPLIKAANLWALFSSVFSFAILYLLNAFPRDLTWYILIAGIIGSVNQNILNVFLAKENIKMHNLMSLIQAVFIFGGISVFCFLVEIKSIESYLYAVLISYSFVLLISACILLRSKHEKYIEIKTKKSLSILFGYGSLVQLSSVFALLTYRLTYYYTEAFLGLAALGILSVGVQISEAVWLLPKSIATVQYAKIANLKSREDSASLTLFLLVFTLIFTALAVSVLNLLPESVYLMIFGNEFIGVKAVIIALSAGIVLASMNNILSHFFSGTGKIIFNLLSSLSGFACVAVAGYMIIPGNNIEYAAWISTGAYSLSFLISFIVFYVLNKFSHLSLRKGFHLLIAK